MEVWNFYHLILEIYPLRGTCQDWSKQKSIELIKEVIRNNSKTEANSLKMESHFDFVTLTVAKRVLGTFYMFNEDLLNGF